MAKNLLQKASDPYLALLAYKVTPTHEPVRARVDHSNTLNVRKWSTPALTGSHMGFSPAQLLMGRQLRTTLTLLRSALKPVTPCWNNVAEKMPSLKNARRLITIKGTACK